jgi:hypothetical protein
MAGLYDNYILSKNKILHEIKPNTDRKTMCGKKLEYALRVDGDERTQRHRYKMCINCLNAGKSHENYY